MAPREPGGEALQDFQRTGGRAVQPGIKPLRLPLTPQGQTGRREGNRLSDLGRLGAPLGELLRLGLTARRRAPQHHPCRPAWRPGLTPRLRHARQGLPGAALPRSETLGMP
jgi:hypothetical protein